MITLITGVPGSGKTLYAISKLLSSIAYQKTTYKNTDDVSVTVSRQLFSNIKGLQIDHQLIDAASLETWYSWVKPGDFICFDEVQKVWPQRPVGSKVPLHISELEEHRHRGVDFLIMTQGAHLVDRNLLALIGRHLHIRRVGNMNLAVVYEWDHCSKSLLFKNAMTKSPWRYDKSVFNLYKSADAHTKTPRSLPASLWFILAGLSTFGALGYLGVERFSERTGISKPVLPTSVFNAAAAPPPSSLPPSVRSLNQPPSTTITFQSNLLPVVQPRALYKGCIKIRSRCDCFDFAGYKVQQSLDVCSSVLSDLGQSIPIEPFQPIQPALLPLVSMPAPSPAIAPL
jgi:zona occludens toxin